MIAPDYTSITAGLDAAQIVALIVVGGTIAIGVGFGIWTSGSVARFFSGGSDPMNDKSSPEYHAWYEEKMRRDIEEMEQYRRDHPEEYRSDHAPHGETRRQVRREQGASSSDTGIADLLIADALASSLSSSDSSDSGPSDFAGGGGDFGGGGASSDW